MRKYRESTEAEAYRIDDAVEDWHELRTTWICLGQYLGMNYFEYGKWVETTQVPEDWSIDRIRTN